MQAHDIGGFEHILHCLQPCDGDRALALRLEKLACAWSVQLARTCSKCAGKKKGWFCYCDCPHRVLTISGDIVLKELGGVRVVINLRGVVRLGISQIVV